MQPFANKYPVVLEQDLIWGDMDSFGHINNTVYFRYFEDARIAYFDRIGVNENKKQTGIGFILAATSCNFRLPLDYPDHITIATRCRVLSPKKLNMEYVVFSQKHGAIAADGEGLVVCYDYTAAKSCEIPATMLAASEKLQG